MLQSVFYCTYALIMPLVIHRSPCYICHSTEGKSHPGNPRTERLTRCIGSEFLVRFYSEGVYTDSDGDTVLAEWVCNESVRAQSQGCNSMAAVGGQRYFHQSCLERQQPVALSRDQKYYHLKGTEESGKQPELRNITHRLCGDCVTAAQATAPQETRVGHFKYQGAIGPL